MTVAYVAARVVGLLHGLILVVLVFGWILPVQFLLAHLILVLLTVLHWKFNRGRCILTQWQHSLQREPDKIGNQQGAFVKRLLARCHIRATDKQLFCLIYGVLCLSFVLSLIQLFTGR